jgi:hypothetical protein
MSKRTLEDDTSNYPNKKSNVTQTFTCKYCQFISNVDGDLTFEMKCPQCLSVTQYLHLPLGKFNKWQYMEGLHLKSYW